MAPRRGGGGGGTVTSGSSSSSSGGSGGGVCPGCNRSLDLYGTDWQDPWTLARFAILCISAISVLLCLLLARFYQRWATSPASPTRHGLKLFLFGLVTLLLNFALDIVDSALTESEAEVTRAYYIIYVFILAFFFMAVISILNLVARFVSRQLATSAHRSFGLATMGGTLLLCAVAVVDIGIYIYLTVLRVNSSIYFATSNYERFSRIWSIIDTTFWATYLLTVIGIACVSLTTLSSYHYNDKSRGFVLLALVALFGQALLSLANDVVVVRSHEPKFIVTQVAFNFSLVAGMLENLLLAFSVLSIVAASFAAMRARDVTPAPTYDTYQGTNGFK